MIIGEEEIPNERALLTQEDGPMMASSASVKYIVIHCSATRSTRDYTAEQLLRDHKTRGFRTVGYHFYIRRDGSVTQHRKLLEVGAHCRPWNRCSIGICYEGGLDADGTSGRYPDTGTDGTIYFVADADGENLSRCPDKGTQGYAGKYPEGLSVFRCGGGIRVLGEIIKKVAITMQFLLWRKLHGECPYV